MRRSAGILPFRFKDGRLQVYLGHFGGPFWRHKARSWGIIKGEVEEQSDLEAAKREFAEETGKDLAGEFIDLGEFHTPNKILHIFAIQTDLDTDIVSNMVEVEYKGRKLRFPEIDRAAWMDIDEALSKIVASQEQVLRKLQELLDGR